MSAEGSVLPWLPLLGGLVLKSLVVLLVAGTALLALRRTSASARHLVCLLTLAGLLALPVLSLVLPGWRLAVLAAPQGGKEPTPQIRSNAAGIRVVAPPETGGRGVLDTGKAGAASSAPTTLVLTSSSSRSGRKPVSEANKEVGSPSPFPWTILLFVLWLAGVLIAGLRPLLGLWGIAQLSQASDVIADALILALASECASALGLSRTPPLRQADAPVPMTWGFRRPVVLLPTEAHGWPQDRLRAVLLHELAHIRRCDWLSHRFADCVCALYWFHPLVWLVARRLRAEGEIACDDLVLTAGVAAPDYARHLLDVACALRPIAAVPQAAIAMARTARIEGRLKMILDTTRPRRTLTRRAVLLILMPVAAALVMLAMLRPSAKAQAAPAVILHLSAASRNITRDFIRHSSPYRLMPQQGTNLRRASILKHSKLKHLKAAPPKNAPRVAQRSPATPTITNIANGVTVILPNAGSLSPLHIKAAHAALFTSASKPAGLFRMVFSSDLTINDTTLLAGVTEADKPGGPWWSAEGKVLPTPVYDTSAYRAENHAGADTHNVGFAIRLPAAAQDVTVQYDLPQSVRSSSDGFWLTKLRENAQKTEAQLFARTSGARVVTAAFPPSLKKTSLRVGIASGPWKTAATDTQDTFPEPGGHISAQGSRKFIFSAPSVDLSVTNSVMLTISTDATDDLRVVAVTTQGQTVLPSRIGGNSIGTLDQITAWFDLPLAQIKEIRVETRPFRWVEFKDIALRPAK